MQCKNSKYQIEFNIITQTGKKAKVRSNHMEIIKQKLGEHLISANTNTKFCQNPVNTDNVRLVVCQFEMLRLHKC